MSTTFESVATSAPCALVLLVTYLGMAVLLYAVLAAVGNGAPRRYAAASGALFAVDLLFTTMGSQSMALRAGARGTYEGSMYESFASLPFALYVVLLAATLALAAFELAAMWRWRATHLTPTSIKEAVDYLPQGLRFADEGGRVLLSNLAMERLGFGFADAGTGEDAGEIIVESTGAAVWARKRVPLNVAGRLIWQETATDITAEHALAVQLQARAAELAALQQRLRAFGLSVSDAVAEREVLDAKVRVHDGLGHLLLATDRFVEQGGTPAEARHLLALWDRTLSYLAAAAPDAHGMGASAFGELVEAARALGVEVTVEGRLPESGAALEVGLRALRECVVNAARHAHATRVILRSTQEGATFALEFENDGMPPAGPIRETGGLATLRAMAERPGGTMRVEHAPRFRLQLVLPQ